MDIGGVLLYIWIVYYPVYDGYSFETSKTISGNTSSIMAKS